MSDLPPLHKIDCFQCQDLLHAVCELVSHAITRGKDYHSLRKHQDPLPKPRLPNEQSDCQHRLSSHMSLAQRTEATPSTSPRNWMSAVRYTPTKTTHCRATLYAACQIRRAPLEISSGT